MKYLIRTRRWIAPNVARSVVITGARHSGKTRGTYTPWNTVEKCSTYDEAVAHLRAWFSAAGYPGSGAARVIFFGNRPFAIADGHTLHAEAARRYWLSQHPP